MGSPLGVERRWDGAVVRGVFIIDAHDREIIAWRAVVNAGISGSDVRDMMLEAVEFDFQDQTGHGKGSVKCG
jgi:putative transposase